MANTGTEDQSLLESVGESVTDAKEKFLGPSFDYVKHIKTPSEIGMGSAGTLRQLGKDIDGLIGYVQVLVSGGGIAQTRSGPLGNKFFLKTGAKCTATVDKDGKAIEPMEVDRYIYVNNVPSGNIPFISAGVGANFTEFRGLVPGTLEQLNNFNPLRLLTAFTDGLSPACQPLTMPIMGNDNAKAHNETAYVTYSDIDSMDTCWFPDKRNPRKPDRRCRQTFTNMFPDTNWEPIIPKDTTTQIYFASLGALGIYIAYKGMEKLNLIPK
jgi:hypothetical protein